MPAFSALEVVDACSRKCPRGDCACTSYVGVLGIDASHLAVLWRSAQYATQAEGEARRVLLSLLDVHRCGGSRLLVSCTECIREEIVGPRSNDGSAPDLARGLALDDIDCCFQLGPDDGWQDLPALVPPDGGRRFDERDRRLVVATDAIGNREGSEAWLVTDDEDLIQNLLELVAENQVAVFPMASGSLMLALQQCGAITQQELESVLYAEQERLDDNQVMQDRKRAAKQDILNRIAVRLGIETAS